MKKAVIRCDASEIHGRGHLSRCLAIAESLRIHGIDSIILTTKKSNYFKGAEDGGFEVVEIYKDIDFKSEEWSEEKEINIIEKSDCLKEMIDECDIVVVDNYKIGKLWESRVRRIMLKSSSKRKIICAIDDLADRHHDCDILLDQYCEKNKACIQYKGLVDSKTKILAGKEYLLLSKEYQRINTISPPRRDIKRIQINLGSVNDKSYIIKIIESLSEDILKRINIDIIGYKSNAKTAGYSKAGDTLKGQIDYYEQVE